MSTPPRAPAVTRAVAVLEHLEQASARHPVTLADLAAALQVPKSSLLTICNSLVDGGLVRRTGNGYMLGSRLVGLSSSYLQNLDEVHEFYSACRQVAPDMQDTIHLASFSGPLEITYLARLDGRSLPVVSPIGRALPATCSATGKALLAELTDNELAQRFTGIRSLPRLTERSITSVRELTTHLQLVRSQGYGVDDEETTPGLFCIGMVVKTSAAARWAVGITMLKANDQDGRAAGLVQTLQAVTTEMTARLGS